MEEFKNLREWLEEMHPEAFKEWKAVYDIERSVKHE
jgi:hypothetical protein